MQILYCTLMCFREFLYKESGGLQLWWYLGHCCYVGGEMQAAAEEWRQHQCRQGRGAQDGACLEEVPSVCCSTLLHQEFNGGWSFAVNDVLEGRCKRWGIACFQSLCMGSGQAAAQASASRDWNIQRRSSSVVLKCSASKCLRTPGFVKRCGWRTLGSAAGARDVFG